MGIKGFKGSRVKDSSEMLMNYKALKIDKDPKIRKFYNPEIEGFRREIHPLNP
jgi:hypothetical protein